MTATPVARRDENGALVIRWPDVDTSTTTPSPLPLITFDLVAKSLTVRNVAPEWIEPYHPTKRGDWWVIPPRKYGSLLHDLTQRAGLVDLTTRRLRPTPGRADSERARCEGSCPDSKTLRCACPACFGSRHGQLARLVWGPATAEPIPPGWVVQQRRQVAWPVPRV